MSGQLTVDRARLIADLEELGKIGEDERGGLSRPSFSAADTAAREWYLRRCREAGLTAAVDGIGNIFVTSPRVSASVSERAAVWSGSHIDTVPSGGRFDGALGAIAALECLRRIHETGVDLKRPVCSVVYADEEGNYAHLLGSSAIVRGFSRAELESFVGRDGDRFVETFAEAGGDVEAAVHTRVDPQSVHATVELHIEQGPVLEQRAHEIGVVTGIVGLGGGFVTFLGRADHAGTTPMQQRRDALVAAAAFVTAMPSLATAVSEQAVITCGVISVEPGAANVVPGAARVTLDFRDPVPERLAQLESDVTSTARRIAQEHGLEVVFELEDKIPPAPMDAEVQRIIAESAAARGMSYSSLPSGAGHDSQNMALIAPTGMIFVPSIGGRSHCPEENTAWVDVENGANVLLDAILKLTEA